MALLEDKYVKLTDTIDIEWGKTTFGPLKMEDAHESATRLTTFQHVFENSSNVGIAKTVSKYYKNSPEAFLAYANKLGLNKNLSFDIKTTRGPFIRNTRDTKWSGTSLPFMSIGYEMELSSLQVLTMYNAIANNGVMVRPYLVKEVREFGKVIRSCSTEVINPKICSQETLVQLKKLLEGVVENGTGDKLKGLNYKVAGKTGTAQIISNGKYNKASHKASFVGYFPADNPQYTCIVVVNAPTSGIYYGGVVAGPVFKEIADKVYSTSLNLHQPLKKVEKPGMPKVKNGSRDDIKMVLNKLTISSHQIKGDAETEWVKASSDVSSIDLKELGTDVKKVPDVKGMGLKDAVYLLENRGLKVVVEGYGAVIYQSIPADTPITTKGSTIYIKLSP
jgi:cell division protein FtsI (penicillin-binding protein 3)